MNRKAVVFSILSLAIFPILMAPILGIERAAWLASITAVPLAALISLHTSIQTNKKTEETQQKHESAAPQAENRATPNQEPRSRTELSTRIKIEQYANPLITTTFFGIFSGLASLIVNTTHGGWYAAACGIVLMFASGVAHERWTSTARKDLHHAFGTHIAANACLFGLIVAPSIAGGTGQLAASLTGTGSENFGALAGAISQGAIPAAIVFRLGMLTAGGYEARNRKDDSQRQKEREEDWKKMRPHIGPAFSMAFIAFTGSLLISALFNRPEYGATIGFIMALVIISADISARSATLRQ
ncbi:hypothetical protein [Nocardiopsis sp. LDBS1602]|uniref:hypothetical protein n=1 Tax=Nocardiopsis sp. LDBS1602 TaxID=3109597 RepID=UPI002DBCB218|nr:hypothetical protein [Nocardiopsis sp. LDBS1602]MEC3895428.1 hypothetical protein [Nocardiopsis sp. LDBS1602]